MVIIRPNAINNCETTLIFGEIYLYKSISHFPAKGIAIGFIALTHIQKMRRRDQAYKVVRGCMIATIEKLLEKIPIDSVLDRYACAFNVFHPGLINLSDKLYMTRKLRILAVTINLCKKK